MLITFFDENIPLALALDNLDNLVLVMFAVARGTLIANSAEARMVTFYNHTSLLRTD